MYVDVMLIKSIIEHHIVQAAVRNSAHYWLYDVAEYLSKNRDVLLEEGIDYDIAEEKLINDKFELINKIPINISDIEKTSIESAITDISTAIRSGTITDNDDLIDTINNYKQWQLRDNVNIVHMAYQWLYPGSFTK